MAQSPPFELSFPEVTGRAREIFRQVVEAYIHSGQPVGSKTLAGGGALNLSPASIRSVLAINGLMAKGLIAEDPLPRKVAAISCGIVNGSAVLDLDYIEDSGADADANFVLIEGGHIAEAQATAEGATYDEEGLLRLLRLARIGCDRIFAAQAKAVEA